MTKIIRQKVTNDDFIIRSKARSFDLMVQLQAYGINLPDYGKFRKELEDRLGGDNNVFEYEYVMCYNELLQDLLIKTN